MFRTLILAAAAALGLTSAAHAVTMTQTFDSSPVEYEFVFGAGTKTVDLVSYDVITSGLIRSAAGYGDFIRISDSTNSVGVRCP